MSFSVSETDRFGRTRDYPPKQSEHHRVESIIDGDLHLGCSGIEDFKMSDIGIDAITRIYTDLMIDDCWAVQEERSFRWIGERLEQHVSASSPFTDDGFLLVRLVAECRVVEAIEASEEVVQACLAQANRHAFGSCYTYLAAERAICATASVFIHEQTSPWRVALFVRYVIGQLILAEAEADFLAAKCSGRVATRQHPTSGTRQQRDDMLNAISNMLVPSGRTPSKFINGFDFDTVLDFARNSPDAASFGASETGIAFETGFGDYTSISILKADDHHRLLGTGLLVLLQIPNRVSLDEGCRIAAMLNRREREGGPIAPHLGAWCVEATPNNDIAVTYRFFIPDILYMDGGTLDAATTSLVRARWVDRIFNPAEPRENAWTQLVTRHKPASNKP